jgi:hypothetical protein
VNASARSQVITVTHARPLVSAVRERAGDAGLVELVKDDGETQVAGREGPLDQPLWRWPSR